MRWIAILACFFVLTGSALAAGSDEQYLDVYNEILEADSLAQSGHADAAAERYLQAQTDLLKLQSEHPQWNPDIVKFRLDYLSDQLKALGKSATTNALPSAETNAPQPAAVVQPPVSVGPTVADLEHENAGLRDQIRSLTDANSELQSKLKEALSVQPAAVSPDELAKAQAKIVMLQKERDLLAVSLDQEKAANATSASAANVEELTGQLAALRVGADADAKKSREEMAQLKEVVAQAEEKLATANSELDTLKAAHPPEIQPEAKQIPEVADQLKQQLAEISTDEAEISGLKDEVTAVNQKLVEANTELESLKAARPAAAEPADDLKAVSEERDKLKQELADRSKDLADAEAHNGQELLTLRASLQQAEQQRDELEKKLAAAPPASALSTRQVEQLEARVAVLEAEPVPYTPDELAAMQKSPAPPPEAAPPPSSPAPPTAAPIAAAPPAASTNDAAANVAATNAAPTTPHVYSTQDLPPGVGALWADAMRASMEHDYDTAESKFAEVLRQDEKNVFVLDHLAEAQFAANHLDACEKTTERAMAIDPDDPASLYLMGLLRYRQNRLNEALDALSLSAKLNPTNSATQNFLGCVLAEKGFRPAAETAFRKSLECDPDNGDAHFNLAVIYAGDHPPSVELARWHYKKAVALGHQRSATLDKLLTEGQ